MLPVFVAVPLKLDIPALLGASVSTLESKLGKGKRWDLCRWNGPASSLPSFTSVMALRRTSPMIGWQRTFQIEWKATPRMLELHLESRHVFFDSKGEMETFAWVSLPYIRETSARDINQVFSLETKAIREFDSLSTNSVTYAFGEKVWSGNVVTIPVDSSNGKGHHLLSVLRATDVSSSKDRTFGTEAAEGATCSIRLGPHDRPEEIEYVLPTKMSLLKYLGSIGLHPEGRKLPTTQERAFPFPWAAKWSYEWKRESDWTSLTLSDHVQTGFVKPYICHFRGSTEAEESGAPK
ncbi:hypothetical protein EON81_17320 [bacterium]|nr:MAG: hypothetical protein EON81_17320 [bacterium]